MNRKLIPFIVLMIFTVTVIQAQVDDVKNKLRSGFSVDAEFRNRSEFSPSFDSTGNARFKLVADGTHSAITVRQRSRVTLSYQDNRIETKFSLQDVRAFGQNTKSWLSNNGQALSVHEAWAKYYFINNDKRVLGIKIGRQEISNPDGRLIWYKNWNHYGAAHDAFMLECNNLKHSASWQLGFSINSYDGIGFAQLPKYRQMAYFNFTKKFGKSFLLNVTDLFTLQEKSTGFHAVYGKNSIGINPVFKFMGFTFDGSFYYQHGSMPSSGGSQDVQAFLYSANLWYKIGKIQIGAGHDSYSGDADLSDENSEAFKSFYSSTHLFFGNTDFHVPLLKKNKGLQDIHVKLKAAVSEKTKLYAAYHMISFQQMNSYSDDMSETFEFLSVGHTADMVLSRILQRNMNVKIGYSVMLPSEDFVHYQLGFGTEAKFHGWAWLMFTFKPNFLKAVK